MNVYMRLRHLETLEIQMSNITLLTTLNNKTLAAACTVHTQKQFCQKPKKKKTEMKVKHIGCFSIFIFIYATAKPTQKLIKKLLGMASVQLKH